MATRRTALIVLAGLALMLAPVADVAAQPPAPRLVVFEGFYNPG